RAVARG
ncbi:hypothetical protein D046_0438B, partial [Vibrio parahaemolyticus V-223/04]